MLRKAYVRPRLQRLGRLRMITFGYSNYLDLR